MRTKMAKAPHEVDVSQVSIGCSKATELDKMKCRDILGKLSGDLSSESSYRSIVVCSSNLSFSSVGPSPFKKDIVEVLRIYLIAHNAY